MNEFEQFVWTVARLTKDLETINGEEYIMENEDAYDTLHELISRARELTGFDPERKEGAE